MADGSQITEQNYADHPGKPEKDRRKKLRRGDRQTRFLAQSVILEEGGSSGLVRAAMITICVVILMFLGWSMVTNVDEVAVTSGEVIPSGQVQALQHLEGGIVKQILIEEGQLVEQGQVLINLDETAAVTELQKLEARRAGLEIRSERLRALGTGGVPDWSKVGTRYPNMINDQQRIYEGSLEAFFSRQETIRKQIEQRRADLELLDEREQTLTRTAEIFAEELEVREKLYKEGLTSKIAYLDAKRSMNTARGELADLVSERERATEAIKESQSRLDEIETEFREQALAELSESANELIQVEEALVQARDRVRRLKITAPVRGIVKGLNIHTVGGVVPPGEIITEIVPLDKELVVEAKIKPRDVGHVRIGQPVTVKVTTYDFARFGGISGELKDVSASTFLDEEGQPYYKGIIEMDRSYVGRDPAQNRVMPGMTVQADIKTGKKTLFEYLLKPVYSSVSTAFRER
ncbi:MAG: HlyD family type I secretion periplasmic adaptor subunit [Rhodospirillales bacterium]|nr:HlyD family type I secretion periplasmic adaptor subunit [Rhodospirillales bacterium]